MKIVLETTKIVFVSLISCLLILYGSFIAITSSAKLNADSLIKADQNIEIYDEEGNEITTSNATSKNDYVKIEELQPHTLEAFIASEDRTFYKHHGLNYPRIIKAAITNLFAGRFKEGASTISQQLIKNTHLSHEKTIKRKLLEIRLTKQLEKNYKKNEILEMYLNTIYFGHACYGIQNASRYYFSIPAKNLTIEQSAMLAGLLSSPNNYSPFKNEEKCLQRRNNVLRNMEQCGFITQATLQEEIEKPLSAKRNNYGSYDDYIEAIWDEIDGLGISTSHYHSIKIKTYFNKNIQEQLIKEPTTNDFAAIVLDNETKGVVAYSSSIGNSKRQPGSIIKPLLVYGPALQEQIIQSFTLVKDEKINYSGYTPQNHDSKYHGNVTITESIANSYNIPAVKILSELGLEKANEYAKTLGIDLEKADMNLNLALGGMTQGVSLKKLTECYQLFASYGMLTTDVCIKEISTNNGEILYKHTPSSQKVFSTGVCSIMNEMLHSTVEEGTAKKLKSLQLPLCAKTGTCGDKSGNTDAYVIAYSKEFTVGVWQGNADQTKSNVTGSKECVNVAKNIFEAIREISPCSLPETEAGTQNIIIDKDEWKNNNIILCDFYAPLQVQKIVKVLTDQSFPQSHRFSYPTIEKPSLKRINDDHIINLCQTEYYNYLIYLPNSNNFVLYDGPYKDSIPLGRLKPGETIALKSYYSYNGEKHYGNEYLFRIMNEYTPNIQPAPPPIINKEWFKE